MLYLRIDIYLFIRFYIIVSVVIIFLKYNGLGVFSDCDLEINFIVGGIFFLGC